MTRQTYVTAIVLDGQVRLRIYQAGSLEIELPLSHRRALLLGSDLVRLAAEPLLAADALPLEPLSERNIANKPGHNISTPVSP
jgi:hypothetical protein